MEQTQSSVSTAGLTESVDLISLNVAAWQHFGYENPPTGESAVIPPLGERNAAAITAGHGAIQEIDQLIARLHEIRGELVSQLRDDSDIRAARLDAKRANRG